MARSMKKGPFVEESLLKKIDSMNAANEIAVFAFLRNRLGFLDMTDLVERTMDKMPFIENPTLEEYFESDGEARNFAADLIKL